MYQTYPHPQHAYTFPQAGYSSPYLPQDYTPPKFSRSYTHQASSTSSLISHGHSNSTSSIPLPFEPLRTKAPVPPKTMEMLVRAVASRKPERSKRFLNSKLYFSSIENNGKDTFVTLTSSNSTWGTICNSLTLGLTAPLCRVYFIELLFQDRIIHKGSREAADFLRREFGFKTQEDSIMGEGLAHWLEGQQRWEYKNVSFEKMQGNCFAVYCIAVPNWSATAPDAVTMRERVAKKYEILDGFDSVLMMMGRFHNSIWAVFK
ncbi:hypothetical protein L211DRAFT_845249 [Terfezia boudieri ATCC MYA-4762]|uniref:Uncharacterized protein n=1 Tax=Terfezia boudieri ATCC MYA-4762 TaxID=1051890 RepID=A0A3N4M6A5_9PEZI|nr:hypothetical protein L211DRAFT_845249 [Terfezia boudieri ATCC MYA-4762]